MTNLSATITVNLDLDLAEVLARRGQIALLWSVDDVLLLRPDLNDEQAWEVLASCERNHDRDYGLTVGLLADAADALFPQDDA